ncbi:MAG: 1-(5-phosphoribosyl)-5-[(5-phosphoribosylamino)methylideneamino]imidazole-4-carboxamide isomerase [Desulfovibrio sp.]|nr:1-(5-phosphoribosyl)-5-[(5-phosphoribosylamino)methylideneamino]imidazole-4-carboxamide isomerase [Desulfovibrio sp.]
MIIIPALDIKGGKCVRLRRGRAEDEIVYENDPLKVAVDWEKRGAQRLHLIDLDGAFAGFPVNHRLITAVCRELSIPVQIGGGIRNLETAQSYIEAGADRIVIGTAAMEDPVLFAEICTCLPGKIGVSLDTEGGYIRTKGWVSDSGLTVESVMPRLYAQGISFIVHTDIGRDGMRSGPNLEMLKEIACAGMVPVLAAGGVDNLDDIKQLYEISRKSQLEGVISGRAVYEGSLNFEEASAWLAARDAAPQP